MDTELYSIQLSTVDIFKQRSVQLNSSLLSTRLATVRSIQMPHQCKKSGWDPFFLTSLTITSSNQMRKTKETWMQRQLSAVHFNTCTVTWLNGLQNPAVEQCIIQISCEENFKQVSHQHCNMGRLAEYCRAVNVSGEIQHETAQNLISTSTFCLTIYILHLKHRIHQEHFYKSGPV